VTVSFAAFGQLFVTNTAKHAPRSPTYDVGVPTMKSQPTAPLFAAVASHADTQVPAAQPWSSVHACTTLPSASITLRRSSLHASPAGDPTAASLNNEDDASGDDASGDADASSAAFPVEPQPTSRQSAARGIHARQLTVALSFERQVRRSNPGSVPWVSPSKRATSIQEIVIS
jgi:hypothetical protein